jgi:hypothetical protein
MSLCDAVTKKLNQSASLLYEGICSRPLATFRGPKSVRSVSTLRSSAHGVVDHAACVTPLSAPTCHRHRCVP